MKNKLTTAEAVRILLDEGYIAEKCPNTGKMRKYTVHKKNEIWGISPHITPKQFDELYSAGVIEHTHEDKKDKYGNIINFYVLSPNESED